MRLDVVDVDNKVLHRLAVHLDDENELLHPRQTPRSLLQRQA